MVTIVVSDFTSKDECKHYHHDDDELFLHDGMMRRGFFKGALMAA